MTYRKCGPHRKNTQATVMVNEEHAQTKAQKTLSPLECASQPTTRGTEKSIKKNYIF